MSTSNGSLLIAMQLQAREIFHITTTTLILYSIKTLKGEDKATPLQAWIGPYGSRKLRLPEFLDNWHLKVVRVPALHISCLYNPRRYPWYSFLLEAVMTPRPQCSWKDQVNRKNPMTTSGTEPMTLQLVVQCLIQMHHHVPLIKILFKKNCIPFKVYYHASLQTKM